MGHSCEGSDVFHCLIYGMLYLHDNFHCWFNVMPTKVQYTVYYIMHCSFP